MSNDRVSTVSFLTPIITIIITSQKQRLTPIERTAAVGDGFGLLNRYLGGLGVLLLDLTRLTRDQGNTFNMR